MKSKQCSRCKETKPVTEFWKNAKEKDGLRHSCKVCLSPQQTAYSLKWQKNNPEKVRTNWHNSRTSNGSHTTEEWIELCERYGSICLRCGQTDVDLTRDHVVPLSKGGGNSIDNIQPLCKDCNCAKYDKEIDYRCNYEV